MRLILLTALTMIAFAANSVLNRLAVGDGGIDPGSFAVIRVASGAVTLVALTIMQRRVLPWRTARRVTGAGALALYMIGFSLAYLTLDAGLGALILFGVVQITMFSVSALRGVAASRRQVLGAMLAFVGLVWVLWPGGSARVDPFGAVLMTAAGVGWALYTLAGRSEADALAATAANFVYALPLVGLAVWALADPPTMELSGVALAILSGAVTSGMGYALWYSILPRLDPAVAATVQLSVPVIAVLAGALLLGEGVGPRLLVGGLLVIGGISLALRHRT